MVRRSLAIAVLVGSSGIAHADDESAAAIEKVVRANIAASYTSHDALDATTVKNFRAFHEAVEENKDPWFDQRCDGKYCNDSVGLFGSSVMIDFKLAAFKPKIVVDDAAKVGWFVADLTFTGKLGSGYDSVTKKGKWPVRATGIVVEENGAWKVAAEKFSLVVPDATLVKKDDWLPNWGESDKAAQEFLAWFPRKLGAAQSTRAFWVNGTASKDVGRDKKSIARLVAAWDRLDLTPRWAEVQTFANGKIAWAHVDVTLKTKSGNKRLSLGVVAIPEDGGWKWVCLNWSPEMAGEDVPY